MLGLSGQGIQCEGMIIEGSPNDEQRNIQECQFTLILAQMVVVNEQTQQPTTNVSAYIYHVVLLFSSISKLWQIQYMK